MDDELRALRRKATTKEDTLELLARLHRAGPEALHYGTHAALDQFPTDEDIVRAWMDTHCKALIYRRNNGKGDRELWIYGNRGKKQLDLDSEHAGSIIVDKSDIHILDTGDQRNWRYRSCLSEAKHSADLPNGMFASISNIVTTSEGTFVHSYGVSGKSGWGRTEGTDRITNTLTGERKEFQHKNLQGHTVESTLGKLFSFQGKLAFSIYEKGETRFTGWNGEVWTKEKQEQARTSYNLRFRDDLLKPQVFNMMHQPFSNEKSRYFPLQEETVDKNENSLRGNKFSNSSWEQGIFSVEPISQHFYEKLLRQYG